MESVTILVKGMTCEHCQAAVKGAIGGVAGVSAAEVDLEGGKAEVSFDGAVAKVADLEKAVVEAGFEVG